MGATFAGYCKGGSRFRLCPTRPARYLALMKQKLRSILLVDDNQTTNYLNRRLLEKLAFTDQVLVALTGREALDLLTTHCRDDAATYPDLLFLDLKMPVMDGFEFMAAYQQLPPAQRAGTVIVMLTTSLHPLDVARMKQLPIAGFLTKPLTPDKVTHILKTHFAWEEN